MRKFSVVKHYCQVIGGTLLKKFITSEDKMVTDCLINKVYE